MLYLVNLKLNLVLSNRPLYAPILCLGLIFFSVLVNASLVNAPKPLKNVNGFINAADNKWLSYELSKGDNLSSIFLSVGLSVADALNIDQSAQARKIFNKLFPSEKMAFLIIDNQLKVLKYTNKKNKIVTVLRTNNSTDYRIFNKDVAVTDLLEAIKQTSHLTNTPTDLAYPNPAATLKKQISLIETLDSNNLNSGNIIYYRVQPNDNLSHILLRAGLKSADAVNISNSQKGDIFKNLQIGQRLGLLIRNGYLIKLEYEVNKLKTIVFQRTAKSSYTMRSIEKTPIQKLKYAQGVINNSFFVDALNAGLTSNEAMNFTIPFRWDVDFSQDIQPGDQFKAIYQNNTIDGELINTGKVLIAQLITRGIKHTGILFTLSNGDSNYYTPDGRLMRKTFLRMPIELARISSKFNPRRKHPISKKVRAHNGVDYAAKSGTPIMAAGSGKITHIGWKGDYGKTVIIQHDSGTTTLYAHMSGFNKGLKLGSKVAQKQTIGYVGATGAVTGAHLHYEFRVNGVHKNPLTVKLPKASILAPNELKAFKRVAASALEKLNTINQEIVSRDPVKKNI